MRVGLMIPSFMLLAACGSHNDSSDDGSAALQGVWKSACISVGSGATNWVTGTKTYQGSNATLTVAYYTTPNCADQAFQIDTTNWTFAMGGDVPNIDGAKKVNYTVVSETLQLAAVATVTSANAAVAYGYSDWKINEAKDVAGKKPDNEAGSVANAAVGSIDYGIEKISDGSPQTIVFGDAVSGDGTSDAKRPTSLNSAAPMSKE